VQGVGGRCLFGGTINFGAVARGQNGRFRRLIGALSQIAAQTVQSGSQLVQGERKPTAQIKRRSGVV
jgi:hypothetical protein